MVTAVVSPALFSRLTLVLACGLLPGLVAVLSRLRGPREEHALTIPEVNNPTELRTALTFGILYALVLLVAAWLNDVVGTRGVYAVALVSGLTDVDAVTLSSLRLFAIGSLSEGQAVTVIAIAVVSNVAFKLGLVLVAGGRELFMRCVVPMLLVAAGLGAGLAAFS